jgi:hypothetical protein
MSSGIAYRYFVSAYNALGGESGLSAGLAVTPINEPIAAAAPTLVTKGKDFITVKWLPPTDMGGSEVTKYILYARPEYDPTYKQIYAGIALTFQFTAAEFPAILVSGFNYQFKVRSVNAAG